MGLIILLLLAASTTENTCSMGTLHAARPLQETYCIDGVVYVAKHGPSAEVVPVLHGDTPMQCSCAGISVDIGKKEKNHGDAIHDVHP